MASRSLPGTATVCPGPTFARVARSETDMLLGDLGSSATSTGAEPVLRSSTLILRPNTAVVSFGSTITSIWPGASTSRSICRNAVGATTWPLAGSIASTASASG